MPTRDNTDMDATGASRIGEPLLALLVRSFSTTSRPALRAASGRPRPAGLQLEVRLVAPLLDTYPVVLSAMEMSTEAGRQPLISNQHTISLTRSNSSRYSPGAGPGSAKGISTVSPGRML
jgi:hypothetical protein